MNLFKPEAVVCVHEEPYTVCPECGYRGSIQDFDVLGACDNNLFCTQCHCEFDPGSYEWVTDAT